MDNVNQTVYKNKRLTTRMQSKMESKARQSVFIMFLISLLFIVSFLPQLILRLIGALNAELIYTLSDKGRAVYKFFLSSYFINSAVNPFVYCACAPNFRKAAKALLFRRTKNRMN